MPGQPGNRCMACNKRFPGGHTAGLTGGLTFSLKWTCFFTALSTIGSSRQKQALRLSGFLVGGLVLGMGAQIFVLPYLDSIFGFTILFIVVTGLASWFATCSPRLSFLWFADSYLILSHPPAGVRDTDIARGRKGPRGWRPAGVIHHVACIRSALARPRLG
jgi:hypothetical protein